MSLIPATKGKCSKYIQCMLLLHIVRHLSISFSRVNTFLQSITSMSWKYVFASKHILPSPACSSNPTPRLIPFTPFQGFGIDAPTSFHFKQFIYTPMAYLSHQWNSLSAHRPYIVPTPANLFISSSKPASGKVSEQRISTWVQHGHMYLYIYIIYWALYTMVHTTEVTCQQWKVV